MQFGRSSEKLDRSDRTTGIAARRARDGARGKYCVFAKDRPAMRPLRMRRNPCGGRCRHICRGKCESTCRSRKPAPTAAENYETSRGRCLGNSGVRAGAVPSDPAGAVEAGLRVLRTKSSKRQRRVDRSSVVWRDQDFWRMCWSRNMRSLAVVSPVGDLRARRGRTGSLDTRRLGWGNEPFS